MVARIDVYPGAARVCAPCAVRFNTAACPACGAAPTFLDCTPEARAWLRAQRREGHTSRHRRSYPREPEGTAPPPDSPLTVAGTLGLAVAANALTWMATASPLLAIAAGAAVGVAGAVSARLKDFPSRTAPGLCVLDVYGVGVSDAEAPRDVIRGVLRGPPGERDTRRLAARGIIRNVAVADLLGPSIELIAEGGARYVLHTDGATLRVRGELREGNARQLRVGRHLHALTWLRGASTIEPLAAIALHDGTLVEVGGEVEATLAIDAPFRSAAGPRAVRARGGVITIRVL